MTLSGVRVRVACLCQPALRRVRFFRVANLDLRFRNTRDAREFLLEDRNGLRGLLAGLLATLCHGITFFLRYERSGLGPLDEKQSDNRAASGR